MAPNGNKNEVMEEGFSVWVKMRVFFKKLNFPARAWQFLHYPLKNINVLSLLFILGIVIAVTVVLITLRHRVVSNDLLSSNKYSVFGQLEELKNKHDYFYKIATPLEKYIKWKVMFYGWKYKLNGDPKIREADCIGLLYIYYRAWGANFRLESIPWFIKRVNNLRERNPDMIRKSIDQLVTGDIIILKYSESNQHAGMVIDTPNGQVRYVSMNVRTMTESDDLINFNDPAVVFICEHCFELWAGDAYEALNRR